ncbi:MAG TPA: phenylacetate--CoA ligase family protein [Pirellulaceae bacterium]|nr:phenylacetate--CoA ligase family protein [Pirellulaceae bacterium]
MPPTTYEQRRQREGQSPTALAAHQTQRLNALLAAILPQNRFYADKLASVPHQLESLEQLAALPYTYKDELANASQRGDFAANLTYPIDHYVRYHRTSGTRGRPIVVLDTLVDWQWWLDTWQYILDAADVTPADRVLMAFSFGPFIGFWSAHDACIARNTLTIPTGGLSTKARLDLITVTQATVIFTTPSYALHMAEVAEEAGIVVGELGIRAIIVAGEPGGSVPAVRERIERTWNARLIDHAGASEVGPWGYGDPQARGLHVIEAEFIAEFLSVETGSPAVEGELSELILTSLGRYGSPVIRYRTGDLVRPSWNSAGENRFVLLTGGVLGRVDDMLVVRGVNIFPTSIEQILLSFPEVVEWRMTARKAGAMDSLSVEIEDHLQNPARVAEELQLRLGLKVDVQCVALGSLPRFEGKGKRFIDQRQNTK